MEISKRTLKMVLLVLVLIGGGYWTWNRYFRVSKNIRVNPVLRHDLELLQNEKTTTPIEALANALRRLNGYHLKEGVEEALKLVGDPRSQMRGAVAESLAMHPLEGAILNAEVKLLEDQDEYVRLSALDAISRSKDAKRDEYLNRVASNPKASAAEILTAHAGLYSTAKDASRETHLTAIRETLQKRKGEPQAFNQGIKLMLRLAPGDAASADLLQGIFLDPATPKEELPQLYRYLVRNRPDLLRKRYLQDVKHAYVPVRVTALNSILELCPPDRWSAIQAIAGDPHSDASLKSLANRLAGYLGGAATANGAVKRPSVDRCDQRKPKTK
jgi:hypothetical protein